MRTWLVLAAAARVAAAQPANTPPSTPDYRPPPNRGADTVIQVQGERSLKNIAILASIAGAGALAGGIGLYYNLDSRSASDQVSAHLPTGKVWTPELQATFDRAHDSAVKAEVFYGVGAALVIGAAVGLIVTEPKTETIVIHPRGVALAWRF